MKYDDAEGRPLKQPTENSTNSSEYQINSRASAVIQPNGERIENLEALAFRLAYNPSPGRTDRFGSSGLSGRAARSAV